jgi:hypothetical protein
MGESEKTMKADGGSERTISQVLKAPQNDRRAEDWDDIVRRAFLEGCVQQGVRADLARRALAEAKSTRALRDLEAAADDAARRAATAWLTIENCLEQYGELAALALERCIEEASLQVRRTSSVPPAKGSGTGLRLAARDDAALAIVNRGRARLARFWGASDTSAA